jgi:hypothetical protein
MFIEYAAVEEENKENSRIENQQDQGSIQALTSGIFDSTTAITTDNFLQSQPGTPIDMSMQLDSLESSAQSITSAS